MTTGSAAASESELLTTIGRAMLAGATGEWKSLTFDVTAAANMVDAGLTIERPDGTLDQRGCAEDGALGACYELRGVMHQEGKGTWYNATFVVDDAYQISADFDYENAPFGGMANDDDPDDEGVADPEQLLEDQRMYPRDPEVLPDWHPARASEGK